MRRMRAGTRQRDGGASGTTAPLCFAAFIPPSGTFSRGKAREKEKNRERRAGSFM
jgi:hypothetical protein